MSITISLYIENELLDNNGVESKRFVLECIDLALAKSVIEKPAK